MKTRFLISLLSLAAFATTGTCFADAAAGKALFAARCATCHGAEGAGDGPIAAGLPPEMKPRNLKEGKFKFAVDEAKFNELLTKGGSAVGLNALMPPQPDLKDPDKKSLYEFVKSLKK